MRLIDADKGIEEYKEIRRKLIEKGADLFGDEIDGLDYIIRQLELQPTAYDVEAVLAELNNLAMWREVLIYPLDHRERTMLAKVEEIVRGGRND